MITLYGIKNCDTVKKARTWLADQGIEFRFHDFKSEGIDETTLKSWVAALGWETVLNTRGTTFRGLPDSDKADLNETKAIALMRQHTSLIKRPVYCDGKTVNVGFSAERYAELTDRQGATT